VSIPIYPGYPASPAGIQATIYGDGEAMLGNSHGGNDTLGGSPGNDDIYGDARVMADGARGGDDILSGGGGGDNFRFAGHFGNDVVRDFHVRVDPFPVGPHWPQGPDHLVFDVPGVDGLANLSFATATVNGVTSTVITAANYGTVTVNHGSGFSGSFAADSIWFV
jgi:Ca2+-binding RTX toxin-like protein